MKPIKGNDTISHLQLQNRLQTPKELADATGAYVKSEWNFEAQLRKTLAGQEFLNEETSFLIHISCHYMESVPARLRPW